MPNALLVVSIPASDSLPRYGSPADRIGKQYEVGGRLGLRRCERLRAVMHRVDSPWQPATAEESFEIVRRRLFKPSTPTDTRTATRTARRLVQIYRARRGVPGECREPPYGDGSGAPTRSTRSCSTGSTRTGRHWSGSSAPAACCGSWPPSSTPCGSNGDQRPADPACQHPARRPEVFEEITRHLEDNWKPVIDTDVDGPGILPAALDRDN